MVLQLHHTLQIMVLALVPFLLVLLSTCDGFYYWVNTCPSITSCTCYESVVCGGKTNPLSQIPTFSKSISAQKVYLEDNLLTSVPTNAFTNLEHINSLYLQRNQISTVASTAFSKLASTLQTLDISYNKFRTVPAELATLVNLHYLFIQYNPIISFDGPLFKGIGNSLTVLEFGSPELTSWPKDIHYLQHLRSLTFHGTKITSLPAHAFQGFQTTLTNLEIADTGLHQIPPAVCDLSNLHTLNFSNNVMSNSVHLVPSCHSSLATVKNLYLRNDGLTVFPNINLFPNLDRILVQDNPHITAIDSQNIPSGNRIVNVGLEGNGFTTIPSAVHKFSHVVNLMLNDNHIQSISSALNLPALQVLILDNNPIGSISTSAFVHSPHIHNLSLRNVRLTTIPMAISALRDLNFLELQGANIQCTCSLKWMTQWVANLKTSFLNVYAQCVNVNKYVMPYVRQDLPQCP